MSKYTTELRFLCESLTGHSSSVGFNDTQTVIAAAIPKIFSFDFPVFDEGYKNVLCTKIIKHYYTREICAETFGRWQLFLDAKLNEIMPYYNELYKSAQIEFNPLHDTDVVIEHEGAENNTGSRNSVRTDNLSSRALSTTTNDTENSSDVSFSDTPQGSLENVRNGAYLTTATINKSNGNSTSVLDSTTSNTGTQSGEENSEYGTTDMYIKKISGKNGGTSYAKLLSEYRKTLINIDSMIIAELHDLFISIY